MQKVFRFVNRSLYCRLLIQLLVFLIVPFLVVSVFFYGRIFAQVDESYHQNHELIMEMGREIREEHIYNMYRIADRISSSSKLTGFLVTGYTNRSWSYYANEIKQMVSGGISYENTYIPKIYYQNTTIPRGFSIFYLLSDLKDAQLVQEFLSSQETQRWVLPEEAQSLPANLFTPFQNSYTYMRKVMVDDKMLYLLTLSIDEKQMDTFLYHESISQGEQFFAMTTPEAMAVNYTGEDLPSLSFDDEGLGQLAKRGYRVDTIEFANFPQRLVYIWSGNKQREYWRLVVIIYFLVLSLAIGAVIRFVHKLFSQIVKCVHSFEACIQNRFQTRLEVHGDNEIAQIERSFNSLIDQIQYLMRLSAQQSARMKESQLKALQQQINPHFLYNTLNIFSYRMELYKHYDEADAMASFSSMLRYSIAPGKYATIGEELEQAENYIRIQKLKNQDVTYKAEVAPELRQRRIIRFLLQPLIENSFTHGYCGRPLEIRLSCMETDGMAEFRIWDNGKGISSERLKAIEAALRSSREESNERIGLKNIHLRLKLFYSQDCMLHISSEEDVYTEVAFCIPLSLTPENARHSDEEI